MGEFAEAFKIQRLAQFKEDRVQALRAFDDLQVWRVFSLRWNLAPPFPYGFNNPIAPLAVIHRLRCIGEEFDDTEKLVRAEWLIANNYAAAGGISIVDGKVMVSTPKAE
jgi:hypothetical protein